ncbi:MAG: NCS2 family permease [Actinomycetota bacterium]
MASTGLDTKLDRYFRISERGSSIRTEVLAGLTTFLAMAYILFLNPVILVGLPPAAVLTVTALAAGVMTIAMGFYGRVPIAMAAGLGLNTFVAVTLVGAYHLSWPAAMGVVVLEGIVITLLVLTGLREAMLHAIPNDLKRAMAVGIGLFVAFIGLQGAGIVSGGVLGSNLLGSRTLVFGVGLMATIILLARKVRGAFLLGILAATVVAVIANQFTHVWGRGVTADLPERVFATPDFSLVGDVDILGVFDVVPFVTAIGLIVALMLADFFDTLGTVVGVTSLSGDMSDDGKLPGIRRVLLVDSLGAVFGGLTSSSSNTTFIESAAGVSDGGRTGLASIVTGALFLVALFLSPLAAVVPPEATAPALVVVGFLMMRFVVDIDWRDPSVGVPALLTVLLMPLTGSIANGIGAGFIAYVVVAVVRGRAFKVHWLLYVVSLVFAWYFARGLIA